MEDYEKSKEDLIKRLRRIEGQVKGLQRMLQEDKYCVDVLVQIAAARAALNKVGILVFENHTRQCVKNALDKGRDDEVIDNLVMVLGKFLK